MSLMPYNLYKTNYTGGGSVYKSQFINIIFLTQFKRSIFPHFQNTRTSNTVVFVQD